MNKKLLSLVIAGILAVTSLPAVSASAKVKNSNTNKPAHTNIISEAYYWCSGDGVRVRADHNGTSTVLGLLYYGDPITVDTADDYIVDGYYKIIFNGQTGYVAERYVKSAE